ncbi:hypothetical protein HHS34_010560 [Acidithiobacillus montserratensis]|uniref:Uncharacterized protein n=1 Tax=Acidithiobacillus montserratensis TaxID=2729135 RepID=A0ACD5HCZ9_9PROT|nr:hypothetical protein [Acidithiobacillus montserratensis]MBN2678810.1 hypothetical protein [Acidithiobacillaceae bacterium]MBU2748831.1 hypothetical protein [Acidithiobacillus montserratensis]
MTLVQQGGKRVRTTIGNAHTGMNRVIEFSISPVALGLFTEARNGLAGVSAPQVAETAKRIVESNCNEPYNHSNSLKNSEDWEIYPLQKAVFLLFVFFINMAYFILDEMGNQLPI